MPTRSGSIGSAGHTYYADPVSTGITLGSAEYPNGTINFVGLQDSSAEIDNVWMNNPASATVWLCDSAGNNAVELFSYSLRARKDGWGYITRTPNSATVNSQALAGKTLYIKFTGNTTGICLYGVCPITIGTAMLYTGVTQYAKIKKEDINQTGTSITAGTKINASIKSGLTAGTKITAADFNRIVLGL